MTDRTEPLFRDDPLRRDCEAIVIAVDERGVQLDRTVCYPQGGGQAGDAGTMIRADGRHRAITDTRKGNAPDDAPGSIVHVLAPDADDLTPWQIGERVSVQLDWARRQAHMRFHTATHLLCALVPHPVDGCSITAGYARLDFHMTEPLDKDVLTAGLARLVAEAHAVSTRWISDAELDANPQLVRSMSVQPPRGSGRVRLLEIADVDLQPCGGTHVANTTEIGAVVVTKIEKKSANTRRVVLGFDADQVVPMDGVPSAFGRHDAGG
jgi:misacylated tRNA(Ala) deacylase